LIQNTCNISQLSTIKNVQNLRDILREMQKLPRLVTEKIRQHRHDARRVEIHVSFISIMRECCTTRTPPANRSDFLARIIAGAEGRRIRWIVILQFTK